MNIDIHTHCLPQEVLDLIERDPVKYQAKIVVDEKSGQKFVHHEQGYKYPLSEGFYDMDVRFKEMDIRNIDMDVISVSPTIYYYWADPKVATEVAQVSNDSMAALAKAYPQRILPMATVPLQDVKASVQELERVVKKYNYRTVSIGTSMEGRYFDDPEFLPFFKKAAELDVVVLFHPYYVGDRLNLGDYYMTNLIGNPLDTTICISRLVFGGIFEKCPNSQFVFVHGGGYIPYQRGRLQHGHSVRPESKVIIGNESPAKYFDQLYFDTITHYQPALKYLIESHGSSKIVLGSDYPFDMADSDPVAKVKDLGFNEKDAANVLGNNVASLLGVKL